MQNNGVKHLHRGSVLVPHGRNKYHYRRRIGGRYFYRSLRTDDFERAYNDALDYEKMDDIAFLRSTEPRNKFRTFGEVSEQYLDEGVKHLAEGSRKVNRERLQPQLPYYRHKVLESITASFIETTATKIQNKRGFSEATRQKYIYVISAVLSFAVDRGYIEFNQAKKVKMRPVKKNRAKIAHTRQEVLLMIDQAEGYLKPILALCYYMGLLIRDVLSLMVKDVLLDSGDIIFDEHKKNERKRVPIPEQLKPILRAYITEYTSISKWLFKGRDDKPLAIPYQVMKDFMKSIGIRYRGFHILRDTFITHAREDGIPDAIIKFYTGHSTAQVFENYSHVGQDREVVENWMKKFNNNAELKNIKER